VAFDVLLDQQVQIAVGVEVGKTGPRPAKDLDRPVVGQNLCRHVDLRLGAGARVEGRVDESPQRPAGPAGSSNGVAEVIFDREAESPEQAVRSAVAAALPRSPFTA
jgi:hypothetical protein